MNGESAIPYSLAKRFVEKEIKEEHAKAVQGQVHVTMNLFMGLLVACKEQNGIAAEALLRSLFDSAVNAIILAKHPEKLADFIRYGKFTHMRMLRFITDVTPTMKKECDRLITATEAEWKPLFDEFRHSEWHGLGTKDSFREAEYDERMYDKYFRPASAYAHAEPYILVFPEDDNWNKWAVSQRPKLWMMRAVSAYNLGCMAMIHMLAVISREFKLGYEDELARSSAEADKFRQLHVDAIKETFEEHYGEPEN